jgi:D-glycero-alpha-D-manno-heptose 1-phosphate guanylyltransferase
MKEAIILAGGFGTRLQSVIQDIPKPMSPIGGKPFLGFLLEQLLLSGFSRTVLSVGYRHEVISRYFGGSFGAMQLDYCVEDTPLGTGGAIAKALQQTVSDDVLAVNGDSILLASLERFYDFHCARGLFTPANPSNFRPVSIALKAEKNFDRYGSVTLDGNRIVHFEEKKQVAEGVFNAGLYWLHTSVRDYLSDLPVPFSFEKEIFEKQVFPISGCTFHDYFIDIGIPEDYARAQTELFPAFKQYADHYAKT